MCNSETNGKLRKLPSKNNNSVHSSVTQCKYYAICNLSLIGCQLWIYIKFIFLIIDLIKHLLYFISC